jgi:hypothetical protein
MSNNRKEKTDSEKYEDKYLRQEKIVKLYNEIKGKLIMTVISSFISCFLIEKFRVFNVSIHSGTSVYDISRFLDYITLTLMIYILLILIRKNIGDRLYGRKERRK